MISHRPAHQRLQAAVPLGLAVVVICCLLASPAASEESKAIFKLELEDLDGEELMVGDLLKGGAVIFDFWATWCKPCQMALPEMQKVYDEYRDRGLTVIGVSVDGPRNFSKVRPFASRMRLGFPLVIDIDGNLQRGFKVTAIPTTILYDSAGEVVKVRQGYRPGEAAEYAKILEKLLPAAPADSLESEQKADTTGTSSGGS